MQVLKTHKCFEGQVHFYKHSSEVTQTEMNFSAFLPSENFKSALIWLSGLTCNEENFMTKAGAQRFLEEHKIAVFCPDTSPRGLNLPQEHEAYDFGSGAGFYVDAKTSDYKDNYKMFSYINDEFYSMIQKSFDLDKISIFGHSMGGHGALISGLKKPEKYASVSAFSPIVNPIKCPWGKKAFQGYLGEDQELWKNYDACELIKTGHRHPQSLLVDQGLSDNFYGEKQLLTENLEEACKKQDLACQVDYQKGYDHSYYFISSFIEKHIKFHAKFLQ